MQLDERIKRQGRYAAAPRPKMKSATSLWRACHVTVANKYAAYVAHYSFLYFWGVAMNMQSGIWQGTEDMSPSLQPHLPLRMDQNAHFQE